MSRQSTFAARSGLALVITLALCSALAGCGKGDLAKAGGAAASVSRPAGSAPGDFLQSELRRDARGVTEEDLGAESADRREAAVRTLARIQDERSFEALSHALADEQPRVVAWAAFGVGQLCQRREPEAVRRLVVRAATLNTQGRSVERDGALGAIAIALGRCASEEAERTLRSWLRSWLRSRPELAEAAALGLGQIARARKRLDDASVAQLLDAAAQQPRAIYLYPLESVSSLGAAARQRLVEVAKLGLEREQDAASRGFAIRALAKSGREGARLLQSGLESGAWSDGESADAARSLAALGADAQPGLAVVLAQRARRLIDEKAWLTSQHGVVLGLLEGLEPKSADPGVLAELAQLPLAGEPAPVARRKVMLRCRAAALLAGRSSASQTLLACDPAPASERREGDLALLRVLARGSLAKERGPRFIELTRSSDRVVREAALELLMAHDEVPGISGILTSALSAKEAGVRATAAKVLARYPARAQLVREGGAAPASSPPLDPELVRTLTGQLASAPTSNDIELSALLLDAAVALELLGAKPALESACGSSNPTLRKHAERGLIALGDARRRCQAVADKAELGALPRGDLRVELDSDVGPLSMTLHGDAQPFAVARFTELARAGFYDGMAVHRVVPGFVVQFGDPGGDGFGGPDLPPLRCQLSPQPFEVGSVGVALAGRDTGGSQLFVALRRAPHLDGEYSLIGRADPGWERLASYDRILKLRVVDGSR